MILKQYYLQCLSQASYLIGDETSGRAVVVDPRRDIEEYLHDAARLELCIELVLETHFHADFLSGHLEFAQVGAEIGFGSHAHTEFPARLFDDGEHYSLGEVTLEVLHTPGHTPEAISIAIYETSESDHPHAVLTGDTLFVGDVGRPDLLVSAGWSKIELAGMLFDSIHEKLLSLPDETIVYPAHGAGSACGKNLSNETWSTIGAQRSENQSVRIRDRDEFIESITEGQPVQPMYFAYDAELNGKVRPIREQGQLKNLTAKQIKSLIEDGGAVLDVRDPEIYALGHLLGSINIGLDGRFAEFAGSVIDPAAPIVLCGAEKQIVEARTRLSRIGYDQVRGAVLVEDCDPAAVNRTNRMTPSKLETLLKNNSSISILDVRNAGEICDGFIEGSTHIPLSSLTRRISEVPSGSELVVYCAGGYRSSIAASLIRSVIPRIRVSDLVGGFSAWSEQVQIDQAP